VDAALADESYVRDKRELLERHRLSVWAIGNHLVGQAVCDRIDERHRGVVPPDVWGDGDPEGVRRRAAEKLEDTARAAARLGVERGYEEFAGRFSPIIDVFDAEGVRFALVKDSIKRLDGRRSILGGHPNFGEEARGWDFVSPGHGDVDFEDLFRALNRIGYQGPLSIEWEDSGRDRDWGAPDALAYVRATDFSRRRWPSTPPSSARSRQRGPAPRRICWR
jgi:sugar phosphate isomerase/epimerase